MRRQALTPNNTIRAIDPHLSLNPGGSGRFLINTVLDDVSAPITLRQNWSPEGKK